MTRQILTGNQAIALGALRAGVKVATGYPGTPSTGCLAHLLTLDLPDRHVEWSANEKVAFEIAAGAAWAGHRALCTMKMSGVNVAYDALISIAYSGTNGGLVIYVADDPGVSAGMPEQDSRGFALMSQLPMLEPATPAEAYEFVGAAFELSETTGSPVFVRLTTAVALGHALVDIEDPIPPKKIEPILEKDITRYTKAGSRICLDQHQALIDRLNHASQVVHEMGLNRVGLSKESGGLGIISVGAASAYLPEAFKIVDAEDVSTLDVRTTIPFPWEETKRLLAHCGKLLVLEELEPHVERGVYVAAQQLGFDGSIIGKLDGTLSPIGEYGVKEILKGLAVGGLLPVVSGENLQTTTHVPQTAEQLPIVRPTTVADAPQERHSAVLASANGNGAMADIGIAPAPRPITVCAGAGSPPTATSPNGEPSSTVLSSAAMPAPRPITICAGCPHRGTYLAIEAAIKQVGFSKDEVMVTGDIGCTILGMNPPFNLLWNEVSMGSSISLAQGYVHAGLKTPVIATMGDSTFFHGGIPGLINAIQHQVPLTLVVMDNGWTGMTGMQVNAGTDEAYQSEGRRVDIEAVIRGLGPDQVEVVDPFDLEATTAAIAAGLNTPGVKVVLARRECAIQARRRGIVAGHTTVDPKKCVLCMKCLQATGCPALSIQNAESTSSAIAIDQSLCNGCGLCARFCPTGALSNSRTEGVSHAHV
ncbi:thiamine pyrophosphate-dependent enzyme [Candidatus Bipolaricaulota bacterium]